MSLEDGHLGQATPHDILYVHCKLLHLTLLNVICREINFDLIDLICPAGSSLHGSDGLEASAWFPGCSWASADLIMQCMHDVC